MRERERERAYTIERVHVAGRKESRRRSINNKQKEKSKKAQKGDERETFGVKLSNLKK